MPAGSGLSGQIGIAEELYTNEVQSISGTPSGVFGLTFNGANTITTLATNASASAIQAALEALPNIGTAGVSASGGPLPSAVSVTFSGAQVSKRDVPLLTVQGSVTGLTVTTTTPGAGYGNYVAPTRFLEYNTESLVLTRDVIRSRALRAGGFVQRSDRQILITRGAGGGLTFDVTTKALGLLFKHMMGATAITTPATGTNTRDHTYTLADTTGLSLTIQKGVPRVSGGTGNVDAFTYVGCKLTGWTISCDVDGITTLEVTVDAQNEDLSQTLASASYASGLEMLNFSGGTITIDGANADVRTFSFSRDAGSAYNVDRRYMRGNVLKKEPVLIGNVGVTGTLTLDYDGLGRAAYNKFVAGTAASVTALWEASTIEGALKYGLLVTLPVVRFTGETPTVDSPDIVNQNLPFEVLWDGSQEPVTLRYRTTDTAD